MRIFTVSGLFYDSHSMHASKLEFLPTHEINGDTFVVCLIFHCSIRICFTSFPTNYCRFEY